MKQAKDNAVRTEVHSVFEALADRTSEGRVFEVTPIVEGLTGADAETRIAQLQVSAIFADTSLRTAFRAALADTDA